MQLWWITEICVSYRWDPNQLCHFDSSRSSSGKSLRTTALQSINDMPDEQSVHISQYADDIKVLSTISTTSDCIKLQRYLNSTFGL